MYKIAPVIGVVVATFFLCQATSQFSATTSAITNAAGPTSETEGTRRLTIPESQSDAHSNEPAYKAMIRCLSDIDDLLDMVVDHNSFEAIKPRLITRVRQQAQYASDHRNQTMGRLSRPAAKEMQKAVNRHSEAISRANGVAPGVNEFFERKLGSLLSAD